MRRFNITVDGRKYSVEVEEVGGESVSAPITAPVVETTAPSPKVEQAPAPAPASNANGTKVTAPMPGMILDFKVESGAAVTKNQPIIVLEAMKMENNIVAPCDGVVTFNTTKGANVETGTILAVIS